VSRNSDRIARLSQVGFRSSRDRTAAQSRVAPLCDQQIESHWYRARSTTRHHSFASSTPDASNLQATEQGQDERREVRPGRLAEETMGTSALPRCAFLSHEVRAPDIRTKSMRLAHRADSIRRNRKAAQTCAFLGHSLWQRNGSQWPVRNAASDAGWSA
jgi:hypothetical protein